jgi:hypothetical protein
VRVKYVERRWKFFFSPSSFSYVLLKMRLFNILNLQNLLYNFNSLKWSVIKSWSWWWKFAWGILNFSMTGHFNFQCFCKGWICLRVENFNFIYANTFCDGLTRSFNSPRNSKKCKISSQQAVKWMSERHTEKKCQSKTKRKNEKKFKRKS